MRMRACVSVCVRDRKRVSERKRADVERSVA